MQMDRPIPRWHGIQSLVVFGGMTLSIIVADELFPKDTEYLLHLLALSALIIVSLVLWFVLPVQTFRGKPFLVPVFAPITKKMAGDPPWLNQPAAPPDAPRLPGNPV
jgi:uncharacterized membrane protein